MRVILTFVLIALMVYTAESGWLAGWTYRRAIVIDPSKIDENLANFPVLVKLDSTNFDFSKARADGYDIRFTSSDGVTLLKYERERHSVSGRVAEYWVRIPSVSSSINTVFYIYYGKADALDGAEPTEVWDSNYEGVWHLKEDPGGIPPQVRDATDNGNDGTSYGTMSSSNQIEGRVGKALYFDGSDDYIAFPDIDFSAYTFEFWIKTSLGGAFWSRWPSWPPRSGYLYVTDRLGVYFYDQNCGWNTQIEISSGVDLKDDRWHYIAFIYGGNNDAYLYHDNLILDGSDTDCYGVCNINSSWKLGWGDQGAGFFTGGIDEVRVSSTTRSPAWIKASYHSTNNSLVYIYAEQTDLTYLFRRSITISNSNSVSLYNYQLLLTIDTQTPISNGHLQLDGRDLRFCGSNEWNEKEWSVSYPYWVESGWNSPATRIWVRVDSLPGSSQRTIYMVYGNAGAVEVRNLSARYVDAENLMVYSRSYQVDQIDVHGGYIYTKEGGNPDSRYFKIGLNGVQVWNTNLVTGTDGGNVLVWVYVADVDNDAQDEVVGAWCRWWGPQGGIKILRASDGSIKFDTGTISHRMNEVSSWDIDNDNKLEHLAIVDYTAYQLLWFDDNLSYLRATGASGMGRPWGNYWVAFYDVDNDGIKEIIYADEDDKTVKAFTPTGSIDYSINVGHRTASPVIGDINNDGVNEIAVMGDGKISVVRFYGGLSTTLFSVTLNYPFTYYMFDIDRDGVGELIAFYSSTTEGKMYVYSSTGALEFERNFGSPIKATYLINSRHFLDESGPHAVQDILVATENKSLYLVYPPGQIQKLTDLSSVPLGQLTKSIDIEPVDGFLNVFVSLSDNKIERVRLKKAANEPNIVSVGSEELLPNLPEVLTLPATLVRTTSARLNGELTDLGGAFSCEVWFEYGTTTSYTDSTLRQVMNAAGTFLADIDGLSPGNTYHFRAVAENIRGRVIGDDMTFNTLVPVSIVVDWNNSNVQSITLRGDVEFSFVNGQAGGIYWLIIKQDSTGGHIAIWDDENIKWADGVPSPPPISISPNAVDIANFVFDGFNYYGTYQRSYR